VFLSTLSLEIAAFASYSRIHLQTRIGTNGGDVTKNALGGILIVNRKERRVR